MLCLFKKNGKLNPEKQPKCLRGFSYSHIELHIWGLFCKGTHNFPDVKVKIKDQGNQCGIPYLWNHNQFISESDVCVNLLIDISPFVFCEVGKIDYLTTLT